MKPSAKTLLTLACAAAEALCTPAQAQDELPVLRPVTSSYALEWGASHIADTYLTPLHYRGTHMGVTYERDQAMGFAPEAWTMQLKLGATLDDTQNPAKNATMLYGNISASWAMMHKGSTPAPGLTWGLGAGTSLDAGLLYLSRNGNNPASAKVGWTLDATGYLCWKSKVWRVPFTLRYQPTLPLTGVFFSPDYGQLYYQIYLGDDKHLTHAAWPGNYLNLDNLVTADLHFGSTSVRVGYHGRVFSSKVNNIVSQCITHALVIGITTEWISLRPSQRQIKARMIPSY